MLQPDRLAYYFSLTHELPEVEFKGPGKRGDRPLFGRVVRGAMAMSNRRGGGVIIIGVAEVASKEPSKTTTELSFDGLGPDLLATWKYEHIASGFNSHTSLPIEFDRLEYEHNSRTFLILNIHEFATIPVRCMKEYRDKPDPKVPNDQGKIILRPGSFYIRTLNNAESKEMLTSEETRTLFELAIDKGIQSFVTHTKLAGVNIAPLPEDKELFAQQLQGWTTPTLEEIRSRGYWDIHIRPVTFKQERVPLSQIRPILIRASLNYGPWEFPYITARMPEYGNDWVGLENQLQNRLQAWRFFQSGQFAAEVGFLDDWGEKLTYQSGEKGTSSMLLSTLDVVSRLTEIFGLASRLATTEVYRDERYVVVDLSLCNVQGRQLYGQGIYQIPSLYGYITSAKSIPYTVTLTKEDIISRPRELALAAAQFFFERFSGYNPSTQLLTAIQSKLFIHS